MRATDLQTGGSFSLHGAGVQAARCNRAGGPKAANSRAWAAGMASALRGGMDALYIGIVIAFFAASWAFVVACDRMA